MNKPEKVTIREVAAHAGVSVMTVSRVLRNEPYVTEDKAQAVRAAIAALGYVPLHSARNLASSIPKAVGLLVPREAGAIDNKTGYEYLSALHLGALSVCQERNYALVLVKAQRERQLAEVLVRQVRSRQLGGFILPAPATEMSGLMAALRKQAIPFSAISPLRTDKAGLWVAADERPAVREITARLIALGHRRIGFGGGGPSRAGVERLAGFTEAHQHAGLSVSERLVCRSGFDFEGGLEAGRALLHQHKRPTAVVCANDDVAAGVLAVAHELQLALPGELSVIGFDNSGLSCKTWPALTTIDLPVAAMAAQAVRQLIGALEAGGEPVAASALLTCLPVLRQSMAPPATT